MQKQPSGAAIRSYSSEKMFTLMFKTLEKKFVKVFIISVKVTGCKSAKFTENKFLAR